MMTTIDVNLLAMVTGGKAQPGAAATQQQQPDAQASAQPASGGQSLWSTLSGIFGWISQFTGHLAQGADVAGGLANDFQQLQQFFAQLQPSQGAAPQGAQSADA